MVTTPLATPLDIAAIKADFPALSATAPEGKPPLVFLDTAASSQKPQAVIDALSNYYTQDNANIHRGVYDLSERATAQYEGARKRVATFLNAPRAKDIVFTRNTTEAINLVARAWGGANLTEGDLVVLTEMEHHSNIVPWQIIAEEKGARVAFVRVTADGHLDEDHYTELLAQQPKIVGLIHISNALGTINPVKRMIAQAHDAGALVLVDAAQSAPHAPLDVQALDCDFLALSGHKMLGPMGIGVLWGRHEILRAMPPYQGGGSMIRKVTTDGSTWADVPARFEAGTPSVGDAIALAAAIDYLDTISMDRVLAYEHNIARHAVERLGETPGVTVMGPPAEEPRASVVSFTVDGVHPHDVAAILNEQNIAVRAGHHCAQPLMRALGVPSTTRASFYIYNGPDDVDRLVDGLAQVRRIFG